MNTRRRLMMQSGGGGADYIKDGLVFWLDGIDKGATDGSWVDLVGGAILSGTALEVYNGFSFDGKTHIGLKSNKKFYYDVKNITIEVCVSNLSSFFAIIVQLANSITAQISVHRINQLYHNGNNGFAFIDTNFFLDVPFSMSLSSVGGCGQGGKYKFTESTSINNGITGDNDRYIRLGYRDAYSTAKLSGTIHAVRIYNRNLSYDEMSHNQQIDNERFHLGL